MSTATLTSLALLKVNIDENRDYFDYLRPFVLEILYSNPNIPVTDHGSKVAVAERFGLEIPERTVQIVLQRLVKQGFLRKEHGNYHATRDLPYPDLLRKQTEAQRHIDAVIVDLLEFSAQTPRPLTDPNRADIAIRTFLAKFDVSCLRSYLRGTALPDLDSQATTDVVIVSKFVLHLRANNPERFDSFMTMAQGHLLANALLCPDLRFVTETYRNVAFFLDTPLIIQYLGLDGEIKQNAARELVSLLQNLKGRLCAFAHSRDEMRTVLYNAGNRLESPDGRGSIVMEARRRGTTTSDLILMSEQSNDLLQEAGIEIRPTPKYINRFEIDEVGFERLLEEMVSYHNPAARLHDINSVRSIYVLRGDLSPVTLEQCRAILVTTNSAFAQAAAKHGKSHVRTRAVPSVISDFSLANFAWLKAPMGAPLLPMREVLAVAYAALRPSNALWNKYLNEVDRLKERGGVTPRQHQLLRSSPIAQQKLMDATLGEEAALNEETVTETLDRVTQEIRREDKLELDQQTAAHDTTKRQLQEVQDANDEIARRTYWRCRMRADLAGQILVDGGAAGVMLLGALCFLILSDPIIKVLGAAITISGLAMTLWGITLQRLRSHVVAKILKWCLRREAKMLGIALSGTEEEQRKT